MNEMNLDNIDLSMDPPMEEPARQYYYMAKCREIVAKKKEELGRPLVASIRTFGCQMNARDSEKLTGILKLIGYEEVDEHYDSPDFVLYNTCTVRENANLKVYGHLGFLKRQKKKNSEMILAMCGCMMQEKEVVEKIKTSYRFVDIVFGTHNIFKLAELLYDRLIGGKSIFEIWEDTSQIVEELPNERKYPFKSGVNIMFGCNNFCSYCIVPYVRGRERSRKPEDIIAEIEELVKDGVVEVMLLGQNVNSYGKNLEPQVSFATLLQMVEQVEGLKRIRFMTPHPKDLSDDVILAVKNSKKICRQIHLPVQSGSTKVLKDMNRHYTKEQYIDLALKIRKEIPDVSISTDIIVGFPGETEEDFQDTLDVVRTVEFDSAFTFIYSIRTGTPAAKMEQVPEDVVKDRFDRLLAEVAKISAKHTGKDVGKDMEVLVEEINAQDSSLVTGRLSNSTLVHFKGDESLIGKLVMVHLDESKGFYYLGHIV